MSLRAIVIGGILATVVGPVAAAALFYFDGSKTGKDYNLRVPYTPPDDKRPDYDAPIEADSRYEHRRRGLQVRG